MGPVHRLVPVHRLTHLPAATSAAQLRCGRRRPGGARLRSVSTSASTKPAARAAAATDSAWPGASSTTSAPGRRNHAGACVDEREQGLEPGRAGHQRARRLPVGDLGGQVVGGGDVGRVADDQVDRAPQLGRAARRTTSPRRGVTRRAGPTEAGQVGAGHVEGGRRHVGGPHLDVAPLGHQRQGDGSRPGAQVDRQQGSSASGSTRLDAPARSRSSSSSAQPATSSVSGRGISTRRSTSRSRVRKPHTPTTYCSGSPARRRSTMASNHATARVVARSPRPRTYSAPSNPPARSTMRRASTAADGEAGIGQPALGLPLQLAPRDRALEVGAARLRP